MVVVVSNERFKEMWERGSVLACPLLKGWYYTNQQWLFPVGMEVCKTCPCWSCHNQGKEFDEADRLIVPETPMPELLDEYIPTWLQAWKGDKRAVHCYKEVKKWFKEREDDGAGLSVLR